MPMRIGRSATKRAAVAHRVAGAARSCTPMICERSVIVGRRLPVRGVVRRVVGRAAVDHDARAHPVGRGGAARGAAAPALLASERSPGSPSVALLEHRQLRGRRRASPSASEKCVISEISSTCGSAFSRAQAARKACGVKPSRFMPLLSLRNTRCGCCGLVRGQPVDLRLAVHRVPQVQARAQLEVARLEAALEQQHRAAPAQARARARPRRGRAAQSRRRRAARRTRARCRGRRHWP